MEMESPAGILSPPEKECWTLNPVEFPCVPLYTDELVSNCPIIDPLVSMSSLLWFRRHLGLLYEVKMRSCMTISCVEGAVKRSFSSPSYAVPPMDTEGF
jgi:hypothetical protein